MTSVDTASRLVVPNWASHLRIGDAPPAAVEIAKARICRGFSRDDVAEAAVALYFQLGAAVCLLRGRYASYFGILI